MAAKHACHAASRRQPLAADTECRRARPQAIWRGLAWAGSAAPSDTDEPANPAQLVGGKRVFRANACFARTDGLVGLSRQRLYGQRIATNWHASFVAQFRPMELAEGRMASIERPFLCGVHHGGSGQALKVVSVTVCYQADLRALERQLASLRRQVDQMLVYDNAPPDEALSSICREHGAWLVSLGANTGIGFAQNRGIERAIESGAEAVLLMDQDSEPQPDMVALLVQALLQHPQAAATGASSIDMRTQRQS